MTLHDEERCSYVKLKYKQLVVDHRLVKPGAFCLHRRYNTDDINDDFQTLSKHELKEKNSKILTNNIFMDFPAEKDRQKYQCSLFSLTCNCGYSKQVRMMQCCPSNPKNAGKMYYACPDRYVKDAVSCNFFVWSEQLEHMKYVTCKCGNLCKREKWKLNTGSPIINFVCINRNNGEHPGCDFIQQAKKIYVNKTNL